MCTASLSSTGTKAQRKQVLIARADFIKVPEAIRVLDEVRKQYA